MQIVPLQPLPNQTLQVNLNNQNCTLSVQQLTYGLFISVYLGATLVVSNVICLNLTRIVRDAYLGFSGDLAFNDTQGTADPVYTGLGSRYQLLYFAPSDLT